MAEHDLSGVTDRLDKIEADLTSARESGTQDVERIDAEIASTDRSVGVVADRVTQAEARLDGHHRRLQDLEDLWLDEGNPCADLPPGPLNEEDDLNGKDERIVALGKCNPETCEEEQHDAVDEPEPTHEAGSDGPVEYLPEMPSMPAECSAMDEARLTACQQTIGILERERDGLLVDLDEARKQNKGNYILVYPNPLTTPCGLGIIYP